MYRIYKHPKDFKPTMKEWLKHVHSDDFIKYFDTVRKNVADGDIYSRDLRIFCTDGELRYIHAEWEIFRDEFEKPEIIFGTIHDITERKLIEEKLKQSEEKYRHLFENSPFSIILFNSKGIIQDCNTQTERIFGYTKKDLIGKNYIELGGNIVEDIKIIKDRFLSILKGDELEDIDIKTNKKNGNQIWVNSKLSKIRIGDELLFYSIIQDITEKKILENVMFEFNQNFFNFTSDVKMNIISLIQTAKNLSIGAIVIYARKFTKDGIEKVLILTSENEINEYDIEFLKKNLFINLLFESGHERPQIYSDLDQIIYSSTDPLIQQYNIKMAYGKNISIDSDFKSGILILYKYKLTISYDIQLTLLLISDAIAIEEKRLQLLEKLEEQNKKLNEIDKLKSEFLQRISHELKTPLISIKGYSDLILNNYADDIDIDMASMVHEIKKGCKRLENLITQLLESSRLESAQIKLRTSSENLSFLIKFIVNELQGFAQTRNQKIVLDIHDSLITKFEKERIYEVIGNLLTNAIKYTPPYGAIIVKSEIKDNTFVISIKDNGIGFTEQEKSKLFQQFGKIERYGNGSYLETEGSGLGLYISKKLIELHGGNIWMESEGRNKGSTFYFSLPIIGQ
jgi:PAS domain S-box-containing protein